MCCLCGCLAIRFVIKFSYYNVKYFLLKDWKVVQETRYNATECVYCVYVIRKLCAIVMCSNKNGF
jgi:hypothetical protein